MVIARLLAVGLLSTSLSVSAGQRGGLPTSRLVVQAPHATWPDGSPVESGGLHYPTDIYAVDANGEHIRNLTHDEPTNYLIDRLPGGTRILYASVPSDRMRAGHPKIFSIKVDGSGRRQLASGIGPKLSPHGHRILFARGRWLYVMRSDGTHQKALVKTNFGHYVPEVGPYDASWSPDEEQIAFVRGFAKRQAYGSPFHPRAALYVINADGTGLRALTKVRARIKTTNPAWAPDGRKILFGEQSYDATTTDEHVFVIRPDGTHRKRLAALEGTNWFWLTNGRIAREANGRYVSIAADGTGKPQALPKRLRVGTSLWVTSGRWAGFWPVSPDGKWIALADPRGFWIAHLDGTHRRLVTRKICCFFSSVVVAWADA